MWGELHQVLEGSSHCELGSGLQGEHLHGCGKGDRSLDGHAVSASYVRLS